MKTISQPKNARPHRGASAAYRIACNNHECAAVLECARHELRFDTDRDGAYAVMTCPFCDHKTYVAVSVLNGGG
jgi:aspartate carbamoyltransferase regulatory subunit